MLRKIYFKEMKDSFRDSRTLFLTVILPIIMMTGLVFFYEYLISDNHEGEVYQLAVSKDINEVEQSIFSPFENIELVSVEDPVQSVKDGEAHAAVIFDNNFAGKIETQEQTQVNVYGNSFSKKSYDLMQQVTVALTNFEKNIVSERLLNEGVDEQLMLPFTVEQQEVSEEDGGLSLLAMLIPLMLVLAIGIGSGPSASDLFAGEKERKTMESLLMTPVNRSTMLVAKWLTITSIGASIGLITLIVVAVEIQLFTTNLKEALTSITHLEELFFISIGVVIVYSLFTASMLMVTSLAAKTVKESQSYSTPVMMLGILPTMFIISLGVNELQTFHFIIPIVNIFTIMKELLVGIIDYQNILLFVGSNLIVSIVLFIICRIMFMKDKWVMN